jgi:hypothetical protein
MKPCSASEITQNDSHKAMYVNYTDLLDVQNISDEEKILLWFR